MCPEILITSKNEEETFVIDTNWTSLKSMLLYPAKETELKVFTDFENKEQQCVIGKLNILRENHLEPRIRHTIHDWFFPVPQRTH